MLLRIQNEIQQLIETQAAQEELVVRLESHVKSNQRDRESRAATAGGQGPEGTDGVGG